MDGRCSLLLIAILLVRSTAIGQDSSRSETERIRVTMPGQAQNKILVLVDGQVLRGRYTPRPDGYEVELSAGRVFIDSARVHFIADNMIDAYLRLRESQNNLTPQVHMQLAQWCLTNGLRDAAEREVLDALRLDPNRADAKRLLATLVADEKSTSGTPSGLTTYSAPKRNVVTVETRSLAGLSRPVAQEFTRRVQPLLMNKCATSGCHGSQTETTFQVTSPHRGTSPVTSERNLAAVLKQIDLARPSTSPILLVLDESHGGQTGTMFRGRAGAIQMKTLRDWVQAVAADIAPDANLEVAERRAAELAQERSVRLASLREATELHRVSSELASANVSSSNGASSNLVMQKADRSANAAIVAAAVPQSGAIPHGRVKSSAETDRQFRADAARANAQDAFDPSVFNRKYHGRAETIVDSDAGDSDADGSLEGNSEWADARAPIGGLPSNIEQE